MRCLLLCAVALVASFVSGADARAVVPACEPGAVVKVRINRPLPCDPDGSNRIDVRYPKVYGRDDVRGDCASLGGFYLEGPHNYWCQGVDFFVEA